MVFWQYYFNSTSDGSLLHNLYLTNPSDTVVFRQRKSSRLQNPTEPEKRSKQQKLSLRTHSLPQLQDRCLMASSSRKGGTWLSRFYHRQAGLVISVNLHGQSHSLYHLEYFLLGPEILIHPVSQLTLKLFELVSSRRTCSLVVDIRQERRPKYCPFLDPLERSSITWLVR